MAGAGSSSEQLISKFTQINEDALKLIAQFLYDPRNAPTDLVNLKITSKQFHNVLEESDVFSNRAIAPDSIRQRILDSKLAVPTGGEEESKSEVETKADEVAIDMAPTVTQHERFFREVSSALMLDIMYHPGAFAQRSEADKAMTLSVLKQYPPNARPAGGRVRFTADFCEMDFTQINKYLAFFQLASFFAGPPSSILFLLRVVHLILQWRIDAAEISTHRSLGAMFDQYTSLKLAITDEDDILRPDPFSYAYANTTGCFRRARANIKVREIERQAEVYRGLIPDPLPNYNDAEILTWLKTQPASCKDAVPLLMRAKFPYYADLSDVSRVKASMQDGYALVANFHQHVKMDLIERIARLPSVFRAGQARRLVSGMLMGSMLAIIISSLFYNLRHSSIYRANPFHQNTIGPLLASLGGYLLLSLFAMANHSRYFKRAAAMTTLAANFRAAKLSGIRFPRETEDTFALYTSEVPLGDTTPFMTVKKWLCPRREISLPADGQALLPGLREPADNDYVHDLIERLDRTL